ncbi:unnamed protein product [Lactuca virosa]|uniref:Uncharacterized protein n=1 Tax=Lactuca virosa TaxID=75947 RepID=A0AAU9NF82_9ASTR|nr:unnamed protein product [Lactuca virosa]
MANEENPVVGASLITRMQNLEGHEKTPQITTVVRSKGATPCNREEEDMASQKGLTIEESNIEEFKFFKSMRAMRKQHAKMEEQNTSKEKDQDRVSICTSHTIDS